MKLMLVMALFLAGCASGELSDESCILQEKRLVNGQFVEVYDVERRCKWTNPKVIYNPRENRRK